MYTCKTFRASNEDCCFIICPDKGLNPPSDWRERQPINAQRRTTLHPDDAHFFQPKPPNTTHKRHINLLTFLQVNMKYIKVYVPFIWTLGLFFGTSPLFCCYKNIHSSGKAFWGSWVRWDTDVGIRVHLKGVQWGRGHALYSSIWS